jgi:hypothetical protein
MYCKNCNAYCKSCDEKQVKLDKRPISINHTMWAVVFLGFFSEIILHGDEGIDIWRVLFSVTILIIVFWAGIWITTPFVSKEDK